MKLVLGVDGSKYGRWATEWIARMPFATKPQVMAIHVVDVAALRAPFVVQPPVVGNEPFIQEEIKKLEARAKQVTAQTNALLGSLEIKGETRVKHGAVLETIPMGEPGDDMTRSSIAASQGQLFIRTNAKLFCVGKK